MVRIVPRSPRLELESFPDSIRARRERLGMTQREFADLLHVSQSTVARWESGKRRPSSGVLMDLMDRLALGLSDVA